MRCATLPICLAASLFATPILSAAEQPGVAGLRDQGWRVVSTAERRETRPGVAPYENLTRVIQITTYVLDKDGRRMTCEMAYDSQRDRIDETCRPVSAP